jgi:hypothetical protein
VTSTFNVVYRTTRRSGGGVHGHPDPVHRRRDVPGLAGRSNYPTASRSIRRNSSSTDPRPEGHRCRVRVLRRVVRVRDARGEPCARGGSHLRSSARRRRCSGPGTGRGRVRGWTGCGKPDDRYIAEPCAEGLRVGGPAPMPYGDLAAQRVQRFADLRDLDALTLRSRNGRSIITHPRQHDRLRGRRLRSHPRSGAARVRRAAVGRGEQ